MKKIVFFIPFYGYPVPSVMGGGIEELMTILLNENEGQENSEYKFYFIHKALYGKTKKQFDQDFQLKNSEIVKIKYNRFFNTITRMFNRFLKLLKINKRFSNDYCKKSFKAINKINPDLIIFEGSYDIVAGDLAKKYGKDKVLFHAHMQEPNKNLNILEYFGTIISVSNFISNDYKNFLSNDSTINYKVLPNCVNEDRFNKVITTSQREDLRTGFGFSKDDFVVLFCGRIHKDKGVDKLIDAILPLESNVKLLIVGSVTANENKTSPYESMIKTLVKNNSDRIKFTGYVKNSELYKIYQSADLQVVPSMWEEAAGLVVIEGQYSGLPQIVTKSGGMVEFANQNGTIIVEKERDVEANLTSAISKLKNDKDKLKQMSESNKIHAQKYNKAIYFENFIKIIKDV